MDGIIPKKAGIRDKESKWAPLVSKVGILALVIFLFDLFARFIQQEADKIHLQSGNY